MTMRCKACGKPTTVVRADYQSEDRRPTDAALGVFTRLRECICGYENKSVEMWQAELSELRRKAYLYELSQAKVSA
jgi:hypothetical protein